MRYLLVKRKEREALLVWVGTERTRLCDASVWVSADGVVMRLCQGRLVGVSEPHRQWHLIDESPLSAVDLTVPHSEQRSLHTQTIDEHPGFRLGILRTVEKTHRANGSQLPTWFVVPQNAQWVEEKDQLSGTQLTVYAVSPEHDWMAGQQCMAPAWCVQWQSWPAKSSTSAL
jgi:hypothetical protein